MKSIKILGTGIYLPETVAVNDDYTKIVDTSDEWIRGRTGISERRVSNGEPVWYMSQKAAETAMARANVDAKDIDLVISTSVSPDYIYPSVSCVVQGKLGIGGNKTSKGAAAIDINCACAGFVYALDMAARYISTGYETILMLSGENVTKSVDYSDRSSCILFGDGAGACVIQGKEGLFGSFLASEGEGAKHIYARSHPVKNAFSPAPEASLYDGFEITEFGKMFLNGKEVYKFATRVMVEAVQKACENANITPDNLDLIIPHQANLRIMETAAQKLGQTMEKFYVNIERYGNTSSASIPICLHELAESGKLKRGSRICCVGFGAGLSYGAVVFDY
ncbi:MAG: ketoacyl-ACP synthase III [Oscillospiraceae bacterium]|nr:ketoacyl-ACP synthase III [Oscillospiraceae bacterium]